MDEDASVRSAVYELTMREGTPPPSARVAERLSVPVEQVRESFLRLADAHMLVLRPEGEILMAGPFSAVPTPFQVSVNALTAYGNCIWDALGIPVMLEADGVITTSCADCGEPAEFHVIGGRLEAYGFMHFVVPARLWWSHIVYT
jgi:hypothetical protein